MSEVVSSPVNFFIEEAIVLATMDFEMLIAVDTPPIGLPLGATHNVGSVNAEKLTFAFACEATAGILIPKSLVAFEARSVPNVFGFESEGAGQAEAQGSSD